MATETHKKPRIPQLRFPAFDREWEKKKLGNLVHSISSGKIKPGDDGKFLVYGSTGVIGKSNQFTHEGEYLLIARVGANAGRINRVSGKFAVTDNTLIIDTKTDTLNNTYTEGFLKKFNLNRLIFGSGQPLITGGLLKGIKIAFPSLPEQQKIAQFLNAVDSKLQQLNQKKELLEQYKKGVMQQLFSQQLRFKKDDGSDYPDWEEKKLGELVLLMQSGISRKLSDKDIGLPIIRSNNLQNGKLDVSDIKYWFEKDDKGADLENYVLEEGDLLINFINSLAQIGKVAIFSDILKRKTIFTTNLMRLRFNSTVDYNFIFNYFQLKKFDNFIQSITKPAVNQASFTTKEFKTFILKLPSLKEQQKIANYLSAIDSKIDTVTQQIEATQQFKKGLLQQLFV